MELNKSGVVLTNDVLTVMGNLAFGGALKVTHAGTALASGDSFQLFTSPAMSGAFASFALPPLNPGLTWDLASVHSSGWLTVVSNSTPVITTTSLSGGNMILSGTGGAPGALYLVIGSTNVALPLASWQPVATNLFSASGNFTFTNAVNQSLQGQFLRLIVP
jgi:hypothetical protein